MSDVSLDEGTGPIGTGGSSLRGSSSRSKPNSDATVVWIIVGLIGGAAALYAIRLALESPPPQPDRPPASVEALEPATPPAATVPRKPPRPVPQGRRAAGAPVQPAPADAPVEYVTEAPQARTDPGMDPAKAFEDNRLFDRPTAPDSRGRPGSSRFENPTHGPVNDFERPKHGYVSGRAPNSDRPNRPDASFENAPR